MNDTIENAEYALPENKCMLRALYNRSKVQLAKGKLAKYVSILRKLLQV